MFKELEKNQLKIGLLLSYFSIGIGFIIYFFLTPFILNKVGKNEYGLYSLLLSIINYLNLLECGLNNAYIRYYLKFKSKNNIFGINKLNSTFLLLFILMGWIAVLICLFLILNPNLILNSNLDSNQILKMKKMLTISLFIMIFSFTNIVFNCYLIANEHFIFQRGVQLLKIIFESFLVVIILMLNFNIVGIVCIKAFISLIVMVINILFCIKKLKMKFSFNLLEKRNIKEIFSFSSFIFLQMITAQILWNLDEIILSKVSNLNEISVYSLAAQINSYYIMIGTLVSNIFVSKINKLIFSFEYDEKEKNVMLSELMKKVGRIQFLILLPILSTIVFFGKKFIILWVGIEYEKAYYIAMLLLVPITIPLLQSIGIEIERAKNMQKFMCIIGIILALLNLIISIPLAKLYGGIGSAMGTSISLIIGFWIIRNWYYSQKIGLDIKEFFKEIFKFFPSIILISIIGIFILKVFEINNFLEFLLSILFFNVSYVIIIWLIGMNKFEKNLIICPLKKLRRII